LNRFILLLFLVLTALTAKSQSVIEMPVTGIAERTPLAMFLFNIEKQKPVRFFFREEWLDAFFVDQELNGSTLQEVLDKLLSGTDISYTFLFDYAIIFIKDPRQTLERQSLLRRAALSRKYIEQHVIGDAKQRVPGAKVTLKGTVINETNEDKMSGVVILVNDQPGTTTDQGGSYQLSLPSGEHVVSFQHVNFADKVLDLKIYRDGVINIVLEETPTVLEEIIISDQAIVNSRTGLSSLKIKDIKRSPTFLGEVDVIKQLQTQPGVTTVGEVASGFNVRGGGVDQNLVLYDDIPVFNTSHALGFFTAFNPEAISNVSFYRGGIPAEFGGRVSSVLNITSREGNYEKWNASGGIGIISSHLAVGGPLKRDTSSIQASIRTSYSNWMLDAVKSNYKDVQSSDVSFYDGSLKLSHKFTARTKLTLSGYMSHDDFRLATDTVFNWNNLAASLRIDHTFNDRLYSTISFGLGSYNYKMQEPDSVKAFDLKYSITYPSLKIDFNYGGRHELSFGLHNTYYNFNPGELRPTTPWSNARAIKIDSEKSLETGLYLSDAFYLTEKILLELGLRYSMFNRIGPGKVFSYSPGAPIEKRNIIDSANYSKGEVIKMYHGAEPRMSLRYSVNENSSVKLGYNRVYQYLHLITNTAAMTPVDIWQSSNGYFKPQIADQISIGYFRNLRESMFESFVEVYYKRVQNILDFKDGESLILNDKLETALLSGVGRSYGAEFSLSKIKGRLLGAVNYTYSRSLRQVDGFYSSEKINDGKIYPSNYDQPHVVNLNWRYGISRRHFFSGNFTYHTGRPMSLPQSTYQINRVPVSDFSDRNQYRLPDYHRLDIAFIIEGNHKRRKLWDGTWVISFYNFYGRKNAYSVFFVEDYSGKLKPYKLSVIGSIIPSLSYTFKL
jgi:hypothetical protein